MARFVFYAKHVRPDGTMKPDPFIPYKHVELSVTRHHGLSDERIWAIGETVRTRVGASALHGRADIGAAAFFSNRLRIVATPQKDNPNHADAVGWPVDKEAQKAIALEVAKRATFRHRPSPVAEAS